MMLQIQCDLCKQMCNSYHLIDGKRICFICKPVTTKKPIHNEQLKKTILTDNGEKVIVKCGDRFLLHTFRWYVTEFLNEKKSVVVRLEGTADIAVLPEELVGKLVDDFNLSSVPWGS